MTIIRWPPWAFFSCVVQKTTKMLISRKLRARAQRAFLQYYRPIFQKKISHKKLWPFFTIIAKHKNACISSLCELERFRRTFWPGLCKKIDLMPPVCPQTVGHGVLLQCNAGDSNILVYHCICQVTSLSRNLSTSIRVDTICSFIIRPTKYDAIFSYLIKLCQMNLKV